MGTILNIQKYSVHDGPGIRTTVFFKGCPLKCWWCHNPESQSLKHQIMFFKERCTGCGKCIKRCNKNAIEIQEGISIIDENKCNICGKCTDFCPNNSREYVGRDMSAIDLVKEIIKDEVFYDESNGGATFSGGEPLIQVDFLNEILQLCKDVGIHTAVDTSGYAPWESFEKILDKVDLFLYDIKLMDKDKHVKYTGVENDLILENLKKLSQKGCNIFIRMPIIQGVNDDDDNIENTVSFLSSLNIIQVNLLPYHKMGMDKYKRLMMEYKMTGLEKPSNEKMEQIKLKLEGHGIKVKIGG